MNQWSGFWGKIRNEPYAWLPLAQHSLDVAAVFEALTGLPSFRARLQTAAGQPLDAVQLQRLAVIALLHDAGKANLGFQDKVFDANAPRAGHIKELAPLIEDPALFDTFAIAIDLNTLEGWFDPPNTIEDFLLASWSHHGSPQPFQPSRQTGNYYLAKTRWWRPDDRRDPMQALADLIQAAKQAFPAAFSPHAAPIPAAPALQHRFAGLVMLADWLGSHQSFFPLDRPIDIGYARDAACRALCAVGLNTGKAQADIAQRPAAFEKRFGFAPRPLQAAIDALSTTNPETRLLIAEAETGSGKTEAALARFFHLFAAGEVDSLYFALPTRVAARELYGRVLKYLEAVFPTAEARPLALLAVPHYAQVDGVSVDKYLPDGNTRCYDDPNQYQQERQWAAEHPKRFLAATVAVGTIDQALLSALQTKHAHLRSVCLDRSLLVVDEVHASDPYMRRLLRGLLAHHVGLGGHAMLLSATLGAAARTEFLQACDSKAVVEQDYTAACAVSYPSLTLLSGITNVAVNSDAGPGKPVFFETRNWLMQPEHLLPEVAEALRAGARVLIVCNTVARAVALQRAVERHPAIANDWLFHYQGAICPHHGRYAPSDRSLLDEAVSSRWGKDSPAGPLVLIGTQTLEQSLDIDADWLITDLCPADVLLQRVGRLHRHQRRRPPGFERARCTVLAPDCVSLETLLDTNGEVVGEAKKAGLGSVYEDLRTIELTRLTLAEKTEIEIPRDNRRLVENATHPQRLASLADERWARHGQKVDGITLSKQIAAFHAAAAYDKPFSECGFNELNDKARTRLGLNTLRIPLSTAVAGPFGAAVLEIVIPGRLAPQNTQDETAEVLTQAADGFVLRYGGKDYRYSRFGLETLDESAD